MLELSTSCCLCLHFKQSLWFTLWFLIISSFISFIFCFALFVFPSFSLPLHNCSLNIIFFFFWLPVKPEHFVVYTIIPWLFVLLFFFFCIKTTSVFHLFVLPSVPSLANFYVISMLVFKHSHFVVTLSLRFHPQTALHFLPHLNSETIWELQVNSLKKTGNPLLLFCKLDTSISPISTEMHIINIYLQRKTGDTHGKGS